MPSSTRKENGQGNQPQLPSAGTGSAQELFDGELCAFPLADFFGPASAKNVGQRKQVHKDSSPPREHSARKYSKRPWGYIALAELEGLNWPIMAVIEGTELAAPCRPFLSLSSS